MNKIFAATRRLSLKLRVLILVAAMLVLCIWGLAWQVAAVTQADLERSIAAQLSATADSAAKNLDHEIGLRSDLLSKLAAGISSSPGMLGDPAKLQHFLDERYLASIMFSAGAFVANKEGIQIADFPHVAGRKGGFIGDREYFREVMAGGKIVISRPIFGRFSKKPIVIIALPLKNSLGATIGVLGGALVVSNEDLFGRMEATRIGKSGRFLVVSTKHRIFVSATDPTRILQALPERGANLLLDRRLDEGFVGAAIAKNSQGLGTLSVARKMERTDWLVIAGLNTDEAFAPIKTLKNQIYLAAFWISLVVVLILFLALKWLMRPLQEAASTMRHMTDGDTALAEIAVRRNDEIGNMVGNFNQLVRARLHAEEELHKMNEQLEQRVAERTQDLRIMTRRYMEVQETEKRRLARELHDKVSSNLTAINLNLGLIDSGLLQGASKRVSDRLADTVALVKDTMLSAREVSADLHPAVLDYGGVLPALQDYGRNFARRTGIAVEVFGNEEELRFSPETEIALYRIALEALTNCQKYAQAKNVAIAWNRQGQNATLIISDDGCGFDPAALAKGEKLPGLGLLSMRERAEAIGGKFMLESAPGKGTTITVEVSSDQR